jgi:hypothetical protein
MAEGTQRFHHKRVLSTAANRVIHDNGTRKVNRKNNAVSADSAVNAVIGSGSASDQLISPVSQREFDRDIER